MSTIDFSMTYPCFVPLRDESQPFTFTTDGDIAIALFSDEHLFEKFQKSVGRKLALRATMTTREGTVEFLRAHLCDTWNGKPVTHVLIDPDPDREHARCYSISEFVNHLDADKSSAY